MKQYIFAIVLGLCHISMYAQISHTITFDLKKLAVENKLQEDGNVYASLLYEDCSVTDSVGTAALPYRILRFIVPNEPASFSIHINTSANEIVHLSAPLLSIQKAVSTSTDWVKSDFVASSIVSAKAYPEEIVQIMDEGYLDGDKRILTVKVAPVQYMPSTQQLLFHSSVDFTIRYNTILSRSEIKRMSPIASKRATEEKDLLDLLNFVDNKSDISNFVTSRQQMRTVATTMNLPSYEYVVITADSLAPYFKRLVDWKCQKGLNAGIVTIQDILNDASITKDEVSNLSDDAGKLRQYLSLAFQNGTKYAFLGGGRTILPIRYGSGYNNSNSGQIPTDLYFSDLNGNWNKDGDSYLGEKYEDAVDYYPELYVGRLLCRDGQEINNYIDKLLLYEQNPGKGDYNYLKKAFYMESDQMQRNREGDTIAYEFKDVFPIVTMIKELPEYNSSNTTFPTGKNVIDAMNSEYHGFVSWFGHGSPSGVKAKSNGINASSHYLVVAREGVYPASWNVEETGNGLDNLINFSYPSVLYSIACDATSYDVYAGGNVIYNMKYNVGESFTVGGSYGGVAFLGNTRSGWTGDTISKKYPSTELQMKFVNRIKSTFGKVGKSEALSKADYKGSDFHWLALTHNLIGCPEFEMWTDIPSCFQNTSVTKASNSLTVNTGVVNTNIAVRGLFNDERILSQVGQTATFWNLPKNYVVTLYKHDYLPYIAPMYLQNESVIGAHYIKGSKIFTGSSVDSSKSSGDFIIKSGANVVLEISEGITLDAGTVIESGASFEVKLNN